MQPKEEIEKWYETPDAWGYQTNPHDIARKQRILGHLTKKYTRALDIGGGEGWISKDLPADTIEVYEISDNAKQRLPQGVLGITEPTGKYDLIIATGVLYKHYNHQHFLDIIKKHGNGTVLLSNIKDWLVDTTELGSPIYEEEYPYREYTQKLQIYDLSTTP